MERCKLLFIVHDPRTGFDLLTVVGKDTDILLDTIKPGLPKTLEDHVELLIKIKKIKE